MKNRFFKFLRRLIIIEMIISFYVLGIERMVFSQDESSQDEKVASQSQTAPQEALSDEGAPILEIRRSKEKPSLFTIELKNADLVDFFRVLAHSYHLNILVDEKIQGKITASFTGVTLEEVLERIADMYNLKMEKKGNVIFIRPNLVTKVFYLRHIEAKTLLEEDSSEEEVLQESSQTREETSSEQEAVKARKATIYDLLSDEGKVFLGKQLNSIMVIDYPENIERIKTYIEMVDRGMSSRVFKLKYISAKELVRESEKGSKEEKEEDISEETTEEGNE